MNSTPNILFPTDIHTQVIDANLNSTLFATIGDTTIPDDIDTLFMRSVINYQFDLAIKYLDQGADIEYNHWRRGWTALLFVSQYNPGDSLFYELLRRGANPHTRDNSGVTALHFAARFGDVRKIDTLLSCGIDPDVRDYASLTPLHYAVSINNQQAVKYFIGRGADIEAKDSTGHTPLWYAWQSIPSHPIYIDGRDYYEVEGMKQWGAPESFEALVNAGADIGAISWVGNESLLRLTEYDNPGLLELALSQGATLADTSSDTTPLHIAARFNCCRNIKILLHTGSPVDIKDRVGDTPLIVACRRGSYEAVKILVEAGADVNYLSSPIPPPEIRIAGHRLITQSRPISWAVNANRRDIVVYLLEHGADPNPIDKEPNPVLHTIVSRQDTFLVEELISHGANPNVQDYNRYSPIEIALGHGNLTIAKILHSAGASLDLHTINHVPRDPFSALPLLHRAAAQQNGDAVRWLLENKCDPNELDYAGQTAAFHAAYYNQVKILEDLLKYGVDLNVANRSGETALHVAARRGSEEALKFLLLNKADPNAASKAGLPPLGALCEYLSADKDSASFAAWKEKSCRMACNLINAGASINIPCAGRPLLVYAFDNENPVVAEVTLANGADPVMIDKGKSTYLHRLGWLRGKGWMVSLLIKFGADPNAVDDDGNTPFIKAANKQMYQTPDTSYFRALLRGGADINHQTPKGLTALSGAVDWSNSELTEWLLRNGALPDLAYTNGLYPLYHAVCYRDVPCVELLLDAGANPNLQIQRRMNMTYLHLAAKDSYFDILRLLLKYDADPYRRDDNGDTPLHIAAASKYPNEGGWCVEALLQAGVDVNAQNKAGLTPLEIAKKSGCDRIQELLTNAGAK